MAHGAFINLDMEQYAYKDLTLELFKSLLSEPEFADYPHAGVVIQAYLRDAEEDTTALCKWAKKRGAPGDGAPGQGRLLGLRDHPQRAGGLAHPGLRAKVGDRRLL